MYELRVKEHFDAAHFIEDYPGKCSREHGHRWDVEVLLEGKTLGGLNMLVDFGEVKRLLKVLIDERLDHYQLNKSLGERCVTAEFLARWFYAWLAEPCTQFEPEVKLVCVTIWESPECGVTYSE